MKLIDYLSARPKKRTASAIADDCGVAPSTISRVATGKMAPSLKLAAKIIAATGGEVSAEDFVDSITDATDQDNFRRRAA